MAPKIKVTKQEIISAALDIVREYGSNNLNARSVAANLGCSTQPIFSNFQTMDELTNATLLAAYEVYGNFIRSELSSGKYPEYKAFGMAYVRFAKEECELFKLLFMCDRKGADILPTADFDASIKIIMNNSGLSKERATLLHLEMWTFVHGIGAMLSTSYLTFEHELISSMLTDVYQGILHRHLLEEENASNKN